MAGSLYTHTYTSWMNFEDIMWSKPVIWKDRSYDSIYMVYPRVEWVVAEGRVTDPISFQGTWVKAAGAKTSEHLSKAQFYENVRKYYS